MQDKKIDEILENYMVNEDFNSYSNEAIAVFGFKFITKMSKIYEEKEELIFHLAEAVDLFDELYCDEHSKVEPDEDTENKKVTIIYPRINEEELRAEILFSFRMQPELNPYERLAYLKAFILTKYLYEDIPNNEEKIGRKLIFWYQLQPDGTDLEIAQKAIEDQVFGQVINKTKERQKKIS